MKTPPEIIGATVIRAQRLAVDNKPVTALIVRCIDGLVRGVYYSHSEHGLATTLGWKED